MDPYGWQASYRMADLLREAAQARLVREARNGSEVDWGQTVAPAAVGEESSEAA